MSGLTMETTEELIGTLVNTVREYDIENYPTARKALLAHYAAQSSRIAELELALLQVLRYVHILETENENEIEGD